MKKTLVFMLLLCITLGAQAQLLWKVSGNGLDRPSYVIGTHHLAPLSVKDSIANLQQAIDQTEQVYGEIVMDDANNPEILMKMQQAMMLPADTTLKSFYTQAQYDTIAAVVKNYMGVDLALFDKLKPATITTQLSVALAMKSLKGFNPQEQLDTWFQAQARQAGKKVGSLETIDMQINVLYNSQTLTRQALLLYCTATHIEQGVDQSLRMNQAYMKQDLDELLAIIEEKMSDACDSTPEEISTLIYGRNANWARQFPSIMKQSPTLFVVGAGHLPGPQGLLKLLQKQGYTVEAMN
ncbi:MAG: TraB/GumN family protein [Phocaeicola sp.]|nr:TraB/GumN family protein [Phocaeicola sp.]